jgi:hypothetical protein
MVANPSRLDSGFSNFRAYAINPVKETEKYTLGSYWKCSYCPQLKHVRRGLLDFQDFGFRVWVINPVKKT